MALSQEGTQKCIQILPAVYLRAWEGFTSGAHSQTMVTSVPCGANMVRLAVRSSTSPHQPATTTLRGPALGAGGFHWVAFSMHNSPSSRYSGAQSSLAAKIFPAAEQSPLFGAGQSTPLQENPLVQVTSRGCNHYCDHDDSGVDTMLAHARPF